MSQPIVQHKFENDCYYVTLRFPKADKTFEGICKLHEEDKENPSKLKGYFIAEDRAWIKYYKYLKRDKKIELKVIKNFISSYESSKEYNKKDFLARKLRKQKFIIASQIKELDELIKGLQDTISKRIFFDASKYDIHEILKELANKDDQTRE